MKAIDYEVENASRSNWLDITGGTAKDSLTLLDYFAAKALVGVLEFMPYEEAAERAYQVAEKMLEARSARFTPPNVVRGVTGRSYG